MLQSHIMSLVTWQSIQRVGMTIVGRANGGRHMSRAKANEQFRSIFGCDPRIATELWYLTTFEDPKTQIKHFLWGLMLLQVYSSEYALSSMASCDRKTFSKWSWKCVFDMAASKPDIVSTLWHLAK